MRKIKVLIAEWEQKSFEMLESIFDKSRYEVFTAKDGVEALQIALQHVPDIIMLSLDLPLIDGVKLSQIIRTNPKTEALPIFYLNEKTIQLSHFRRNTDYFIVKPFNPDELRKIIANISKKILSIHESKTEEEFTGNLKQMGIPDLIQILSFNRRTGKLLIYERQNAETPQVLIAIDDGKIINAKFGNISKTKAFYRALGLREGYFRFIPGEPGLEKEILESSDSLIMEGLRQNDEMVELKKKLPSENFKLYLNVPIDKLPHNLRPVTKDVISAIEVFPSLNDLLNSVEINDFEILNIVVSLVEKGIIRVETEKIVECAKISDFSSDIVLELKKKLTKTFYDARLTSNVSVVLLINNNIISNTLVKALNSFIYEPSKNDVFEMLNYKRKLGYLGKVQLVESMSMHLFFFVGINPSKPLWDSLLKNVIGAIVIGKRDFFRESLSLCSKRYTVIEEKDVLDGKLLRKSFEKVFETFILEGK